MASTCRDCPTTISTQSKSGRCHPCAMRSFNSDPVALAKRKAAITAYWDRPGVREARGRKLAARNRAMPQEQRDKLRPHGRRIYAEHLNTPEARARSMAPEARARAAAKQTDTKLADIPPHRRGEYRRLCSSQRLSAADAKRIILDDEKRKATPRQASTAKAPLTFEEQLARVAAGATLVPTFKYRRPDPEMTLGGVAPEAI